MILKNKANFCAAMMNVSLSIEKRYECFHALRLPKKQSQTKNLKVRKGKVILDGEFAKQSQFRDVRQTHAEFDCNCVEQSQFLHSPCLFEGALYNGPSVKLT